MSEVFKSCATGDVYLDKNGVAEWLRSRINRIHSALFRTKYLGQTRLAHFGAYQQPPFQHR
ncbi:hypothetical protein DIKCMJMK_03149 [Shewanella oneidensis]|nr:hypothetical protein [Shewanella oneidensis]